MKLTEPTEFAKLTKRSKYRVAPADQRRYNGRTYASKAEMKRAMQLDADPTVRLVIPQPIQMLVPGFKYTPDFGILWADGQFWFEDVKGFEDRHFKRVKAMWREHGKATLFIIDSKSLRVRERIPGRI